MNGKNNQKDASSIDDVFTSVVCAVATTMISSQARKYVFTKRDCLRLYKAHVNDEWTSLVNGVYEICRGRWEYEIPQAVQDRKLLRALCQQALGFESHFLELHRDYLLSELKHVDDSHKLYAVKRLGEIICSDEETIDALQALESDANEELQQAQYFTFFSFISVFRGFTWI